MEDIVDEQNVMVNYPPTRMRKIILLSSFILLTSAFIFSSAAAQELKRVRFGYPSLGFRQGHIWVAKDEGLFKKYGLDVDPIFLRGGQLAIQALAAGDPPIMSIGQVVQANLAGFDLALIAGVESYYDSTIYGRAMSPGSNS